jgi:hypothetical protein
MAAFCVLSAEEFHRCSVAMFFLCFFKFPFVAAISKPSTCPWQVMKVYVFHENPWQQRGDEGECLS